MVLFVVHSFSYWNNRAPIAGSLHGDISINSLGSEKSLTPNSLHIPIVQASLNFAPQEQEVMLYSHLMSKQTLGLDHRMPR
jgi:hypothetical protein